MRDRKSLLVSIAIARKHVQLGVRAMHIAESMGFSGQVYVATHAFGRAGETFRRAQAEAGAEFWGIRAWMHSSAGELRLKDPDLVIVDDNRVKFIVEVKWGTVPGAGTDLKLPEKERQKIERLICAQFAYCNVNGPVSKESKEREYMKFLKDNQTKFVLVTDISGLVGLEPLLDRWVDVGFQVADIKKRAGRFPSFREVLVTG